MKVCACHAAKTLTLLLVLVSATSGCGASTCPEGSVLDGKYCKTQRRDANSAEQSGSSALAPTTAQPGTPTVAGTVATTTAGTPGLPRSGTNGSVSGLAAGIGASGAMNMSLPAQAGSAGMSLMPIAGTVATTMVGGAGAAGTAPSSSCSAGGAEQCDNRDNDCDGKIDEEVTPRPCGNPMPPCKQGTQACVNGTWSADCAGEVKPSTDICDGIDNDCSGTADETCACTNGMTRLCGNPTTPCKQGMLTCANGAWPATCEGEVKGSAESCDGIDNDCNGLIDQGGNALCTGGKKCAGKAGCVTCTSASDCEQRTCQTTLCTSGQCAYTPIVGGVKGDCTGSMVCDGAGACVQCTSSIQCAQYQLCTDHTCRDSCGNGVVDIIAGETCDPSASVGKNLNCDPKTCRLGTAYAPCQHDGSDGDQCRNTIDGSCGLGYCMPQCDARNPCPATFGGSPECANGYCKFSCSDTVACPSVASTCTLGSCQHI